MYADTAFSLRWRNTLESFDAGMVLFRTFFLKIWLLFIPPFLALVVTVLLLPIEWVWLGFLLVWWLHPLWDRLVIHPLGVLFFDPKAQISTFRKGLFTGLVRGLAGDLLWRRFSIMRTFALPVRTLERLSGTQFKARIVALSQGGRGPNFLLLVVVCVCQIGLVSGETSFIAQIVQFLPAFMRPDFSVYSAGFFRFLLIAYVAHCSLLIPLRCCMIFSFYLNRRITLEGWDIELSFREYVKNVASSSSVRRGGAAPSIIALLVAAFLVLTPGSVTAQQSDASVDTAVSIPLEELNEILASEDFGGTTERSAFRWKTQRESRRGGINLFDRIPAFAGIDVPAWTLRSVLIAGAIAIFGWIGWINREQLRIGNWLNRKSSEDRTPVRIKEAWKNTEDRSALDLYELGYRREAWALVYNGLVMALSDRLNIGVGTDATEGDVLYAVQSANKAGGSPTVLISDVQTVVRSWQQVAYAHQEPDDRQFFDAVVVVDRLAAQTGAEA